MLFTKPEGRTGKMLPEVLTVRTEEYQRTRDMCSQLRATFKTEGNIFPVQTEYFGK